GAITRRQISLKRAGQVLDGADQPRLPSPPRLGPWRRPGAGRSRAARVSGAETPRRRLPATAAPGSHDRTNPLGARSASAAGWTVPHRVAEWRSVFGGGGADDAPHPRRSCTRAAGGKAAWSGVESDIG